MEDFKYFIRALIPYGLVHLIRTVRSRHANSGTLDTPETIQAKMQEIEQEYGFVGLHMGCGPIHHPGYLNCDLEGGEFRVDATKPLPVPDDSLDYVYSEHFIEHLMFDQVLFFMKESFRALKKGGIFRCLIPDFSLLLSIADNQPELAMKIRQRTVEGLFPEDGACIISARVSPEQAALWDHRDDICNNFMRDWGHKYLWSAHHLAMAVEYVGFSNVEILPYGKSNDQRICFDPPHRWGKEWTSAIEARK